MINKLLYRYQGKSCLNIYQNLNVFSCSGGFSILLKHRFSVFLLDLKSNLLCHLPVPPGGNTTAGDWLKGSLWAVEGVGSISAQARTMIPYLRLNL